MVGRAGTVARSALIVAALTGPASAAPVRVEGPAVGAADRRLPGFLPRPPSRIGPRLEFRRWRYGLRPYLRRFPPNVPPLLLPPPPPDEFLQPEGPELSPLIEGTPDGSPALSHGFHLTVKVGAGQDVATPPVLGRFVEVGQALGRCFAPPGGLAWGSITLRVAFKRDGSVFGLPRVPFSDAGTADGKTELARSLLAGLKRCTPLPLSASLGAAVAGEIFAVRFIHEDKR